MTKELTKKQREENHDIIRMSVTYILALGLLAWVDWKIAVGTYLLLMAHHFEKH